MTLQEVLSSIKTSVYGEDVRNAILGGLELCYSERLSGGYNPSSDLNDFINGTALFDESVPNQPFDNAFLLASGGDEEERCQVAISLDDPSNAMIRLKENNEWGAWAGVVETPMCLVRYFNSDGSELLHTEKVSEGRDAAWDGTPEKSSSAQYDYHFIGWNLLPNQSEASEDALSHLTSSVDVYAAYTSTLRSYHVYFYNGIALFDTQSVVYGGNSPQPATVPTQEPTAQYNYIFAGWNSDPDADVADAEALNNITADRTVYAIYNTSVRSYTVSFRNGNTELQSVTVPYGGTAVYSGSTPTKESTEQQTYAFVGWNTSDDATTADPNATRNITSDRILYAAFSSTAITYTVRFMNGVVPLETVSVEYGHDAEYSGNTPTKEDSQQYTYSFIGWSTDPNATTVDADALRNITADRDIYAVYEQITRNYTVTFFNGDAMLTSVSVPYGGTAVYSGVTPTKASSAQYNYTFAGWNTKPNQSTVEEEALTNVTADRSVYAVFSATVRTYTVRFINDETVISTKSVPYGDDVTFTGTTPTKEPTAQYIYTFVGWNSSPNQTVKDDTVLQNITANRDIYAAYSETMRTYVVSFCKDSIIRRGAVTGTATYPFMIDMYSNEYGVSGGITGWSEYLEYGKTYQVQFSTADSNITLYINDSNGEHSYTGNGTFYVEEGDEWSIWVYFAANVVYDSSSFLISMTDGVSSTNLMPLFANYPTTAGAGNKLSIRWTPDVYDIQTVPYGSNVTYAGETPTKAPTADYRYTFIGWSELEDQSTADSGALLNIQEDKTLYPAFREASANATVRFYYNSTLLDTQTVPIGSNVTYGGVTPTKQAVAQYNYEFNGWNVDEDQTAPTPGILENVLNDIDVYAAFLPVVRTYTVRFLNGSTVLQSSQVAYGSDASYTGETPSKAASETATYQFVGWALQDNQTEADFSALMDITEDRDIYAAYEAIPIQIYIYGIKRPYGSTDPAWERTDDAIGLTATATYGPTAGHSDFDTCQIYKDIRRVTLDTGDVMVQIPKFYYQRYLETDENNIQYECIRICKEPHAGFSLHPAFAHNDAVQDYIYVGAYLSSEENSELFSKSGKTVKVASSSGDTTSDYRLKASSKGSGWSLYDVSSYMAIATLYLVEYATNDSQTAIGKGNCSMSSTQTPLTTGGCDGIANLTGGDTNTSHNKQVVYRGIEDLWGNGMVLVDGVHLQGFTYAQSRLSICNTQSAYTASVSDSNYVDLSYSPVASSSSNCTLKMGVDTSNSAYMFSIENCSESGTGKGYCDRTLVQQGTRSYTYSAVFSGGCYNYAVNGLFYYNATVNDNDACVNGTVFRLLYVPSSS